jgi:hypothetical protein
MSTRRGRSAGGPSASAPPSAAESLPATRETRKSRRVQVASESNVAGAGQSSRTLRSAGNDEAVSASERPDTRQYDSEKPPRRGAPRRYRTKSVESVATDDLAKSNADRSRGSPGLKRPGKSSVADG